MARGHLVGYLLFAATVTGSGLLAGFDARWSLAVGACAPLVPAAAARFLFGALVGAATPGATEKLRKLPAAAMSGTEFEEYVARVARSCGVPVIMTPPSGDWGVDLIVGRRPDRLAIQCKRRARPVGAGAVQEVVAGAPMQGCAKTMVVTNHEFTSAARKLAELHGCELVGGSQLPRLRSIIQLLTAPTQVG